MFQSGAIYHVVCKFNVGSVLYNCISNQVDVHDRLVKVERLLPP